MRVDWVSSRTNWNGAWPRPWEIVWLTRLENGPNAAFPYEAPNKTHGGRSPQSSMRSHRGRIPAQVIYESLGMKACSYRVKDKSSIHPFCRTLSLNVKFKFSRKETTFFQPKNQIQRFCFREAGSYGVGFGMIFFDSKPGEYWGWCYGLVKHPIRRHMEVWQGCKGAYTFCDQPIRPSINFLIPPFDSFCELTGITFCERIVMLEMTRFRCFSLFVSYSYAGNDGFTIYPQFHVISENWGNYVHYTHNFPW
jgi:hypothetical protein